MTTATLKAFRTMAETMTTASQSMTAREMALTSHNLGRTGDKATIIGTGEVWYWSQSVEMWVR